MAATLLHQLTPASPIADKVDGVPVDASSGSIPLGAVRFNIAQALSGAQKTLARMNIGALGEEDILSLMKVERYIGTYQFPNQVYNTSSYVYNDVPTEYAGFNVSKALIFASWAYPTSTSTKRNLRIVYGTEDEIANEGCPFDEIREWPATFRADMFRDFFTIVPGGNGELLAARTYGTSTSTSATCSFPVCIYAHMYTKD